MWFATFFSQQIFRMQFSFSLFFFLFLAVKFSLKRHQSSPLPRQLCTIDKVGCSSRICHKVHTLSDLPRSLCFPNFPSFPKFNSDVYFFFWKMAKFPELECLEENRLLDLSFRIFYVLFSDMRTWVWKRRKKTAIWRTVWGCLFGAFRGMDVDAVLF